MKNEFYVIHYDGKPWNMVGITRNRGRRPYNDESTAKSSLTSLKREINYAIMSGKIDVEKFEIVRYIPEG